jgi:hypothetical protein
LAGFTISFVRHRAGIHNDDVGAKRGIRWRYGAIEQLLLDRCAFGL